ncbi:MAG: ATP-binding protein [Rhodoblastus sp.]|jgi:PAS domain S-box-containing protein
MSVVHARTISSRIVLYLAGVLVATSALILLVFAPLHRRELLQERQEASLKLGEALQIALENAMLKRDLPGLSQIVADLGRTPNVDLAMIVEPGGQIRFSSDRDLIGRRRDPTKLCEACADPTGGSRGGGSLAGFMTNERGAPVLRSVRAAPNREPCVTCHGDAATHPVNGYLVIDYAAGDILDRTWRMAALLSGAGLLVVLAALGAIWVVLRRTVVRPLGAISGAIARYADDPTAPPPVIAIETDPGADEIAALAAGWNSLVARLDQTIQTIRRRDAFLQSLIDASPDGIRVIDQDYRVVAANAEFCRQAGRTLDEVLTLPCYASSHGRSEPCFPTMVICPLVAIADGSRRVKASHIHVNNATGEQFAAEVVAGVVEDGEMGDGKRLVVESVRDLSQHVQVSQEQRLSELGHLAAGLAHEIHNPLASVLLGLHAIERNLRLDPGDETLEFISAVNGEVDRCLSVTERLMRLSRVPEPSGEIVDLAPLVQDVFALLRYDASAHNIVLSNEVVEGARIVGTQGDLGMILINLMQNALHAMPRGGRLRVVATITQDDDVLVEIVDTGVGMEPQQLAKIFHPFWSWRADGSAGSGLGLAICKALVDKWGGTISVASAPGAGTTFTLKFPHADKAIEQRIAAENI